ncbi:MAG: nuclear transport factor 2 family protein [Candidatus Sulfotelmatobacter sp.]
MWKLVSFSLLVLTSALFAAQDVAQPTADEARILTLENAWNQAIQQKDGAALLMLLGPELVYIEYDGRLMNKAEYLADAQHPSLHPARIVGESLSVHVYGTVAVAIGICRESGLKNGKPYSLRMRFIDTWVRKNERWICVASQSTLLAQ